MLTCGIHSGTIECILLRTDNTGVANASEINTKFAVVISS